MFSVPHFTGFGRQNPAGQRRPGQEIPDSVFIEEIIANLLIRLSQPATDQYWHEFIVTLYQRRVGVDIDDLNPPAFANERAQRLQHVVAQVAPGSGIQKEMGHGHGNGQTGKKKRGCLSSPAC